MVQGASTPPGWSAAPASTPAAAFCAAHPRLCRPQETGGPVLLPVFSSAGVDSLHTFLLWLLLGRISGGCSFLPLGNMFLTVLCFIVSVHCNFLTTIYRLLLSMCNDSWSLPTTRSPESVRGCVSLSSRYVCARKVSVIKREHFQNLPKHMASLTVALSVV